MVTGATGFVGGVLCRRLRESDVMLRALVRNAVSGNNPWDNTIRADISAESWRVNPCLDIDTVFHLAGKSHALTELTQKKDEYRQVNTEGTRKLLEAAQKAGVKRFVYFSSVKAAGEGNGQLQDESCCTAPDTIYGQSKLEAEKLVLGGGYVQHPVVIRPVMIYGPTRKGNLPRMIMAVDKGIFPPLPEVGNKRSMVHVNDVVQAAILASEKSEARGQTYIVTDGEAYSTRQIYSWICKATGKSEPGIAVPLALVRLLAVTGDMIGKARGKRFLFDSDAMEKLVGSAWYSSEKIQSDLDYSPVQNLRAAIPEIVRFLDLGLTGE